MTNNPTNEQRTPNSSVRSNSSALPEQASNGTVSSTIAEPNRTHKAHRPSPQPKSVNATYNATVVKAECAVPGLDDTVRPVVNVVMRAAMRMTVTHGNIPPNIMRIKQILPKAYFKDLFPLANRGRGPDAANGLFTYENFLAAAEQFEYFCGEQDESGGLCRLELVTLLALINDATSITRSTNVTNEEWRRGLYHEMEPGCTREGPGCL